MTTTARTVQHTAASSVWTVRAMGKTYRVRTSFAREALRYVEGLGSRSPILVALETDVANDAATDNAPRPARRYHSARTARMKTALFPEALARRARGESTSEIARVLGLRRETLRDWFLAHAA